MAEKPSTRQMDLALLELLWIRKSLEFQAAALERSRSKEMAGSEIYQLRSKEIADVRLLASRFAQ